MPYKSGKSADSSLPWERQKGESGQAYEAFAAYRDMGTDRSIRAVGQKLGKSRALIERWSSQWKWQERIRAYESDIDRKAREKAVKERKTMRDRHTKIAMQVQRKALEALEQLSVEDMTPKDIKEYIRMATDLERLSRTFDTGEQKETEAVKETSLADAIMSAYQKRKDGGSDD